MECHLEVIKSPNHPPASYAACLVISMWKEPGLWDLERLKNEACQARSGEEPFDQQHLMSMRFC